MTNLHPVWLLGVTQGLWALKNKGAVTVVV